MHRFSAEQRCYRIGNVDIGGQPGECPPVLIGSLFYTGHRIVSDPMHGVFDAHEALQLLNAEAEAAQFTSIPRFVDPVGRHSGGTRTVHHFHRCSHRRPDSGGLAFAGSTHRCAEAVGGQQSGPALDLQFHCRGLYR